MAGYVGAFAFCLLSLFFGLLPPSTDSIVDGKPQTLPQLEADRAIRLLLESFRCRLHSQNPGGIRLRER
jgi:hypothetical protein